MERYRSPLIRPGGKFRQAALLLRQFPSHVCYVEPFCGAAHVFFAKPPSKIEVLNDVDGEIMNFFRCAQSVPDAVAAALKSMPHSRRLHRLMTKQDPESLDPIARAARFCHLVFRSFSGYPNKGFSYGKIGGGAQRSAAGISAAITACAGRLDRVILECLDWQVCLEKYDAPTTFFFLDPPYLGADAGYEHELDEAGHRDLAGRLKSARGKWLLTVGDHPLMRQLYRGFRTRLLRTGNALRKERRGRYFRELIIRSY